MKGAVAAGHRQTAEAGARMLEEGGNAFDACVAAVFASSVTESPLTGPGSGGFMLVHRASDRSTRVADFFVSAPGLERRHGGVGEMRHAEVWFGDSGQMQEFKIGPASVAVPGTVAGLEAVHRRYGRLPWREVLAPAIELARDGVEITPHQAGMHAILDPILRSDREGRRVYSKRGSYLRGGDLLRLPDLADTFEVVGSRGARTLYRGERAKAILATVRDGGGAMTQADLDAYRVVWRRPVTARFCGYTLESNPPPSAGGVLIAYGLALCDRLGTCDPESVDAFVRLVGVMREQTRARGPGFARGLHRGGVARDLLGAESLRGAERRIRNGEPARAEHVAAGTTHVSVVDAEGNAASASTSTGSGSGVIVPGTGVYLNNMLGESDLAIGALPPGRRLTSMMAPSVLLGANGAPRLVIGSAGSARLRGAIMQVVINVLEHGMGVEDAIAAPRVHLDEADVHCEGGLPKAEVKRLGELGYDVIRWRDRNVFFGGVSAVEVLTGGELAAAGDPRRGGAGIVV